MLDGGATGQPEFNEKTAYEMLFLKYIYREADACLLLPLLH